jgi:Asp-tRNA(Asn)/Glu-tRNA(Gln) amidotransferase A subunit family amidase
MEADMTDQQQTTALALRERMRAGELSALDVVNAYIQQVEAREGDIQAFSWFDAGYARQQAEQLDQYRMRGLPLGPLHGIPVALKDIINTKAIPTENGTNIDKGRVPAEDAIIVQRLRSAGAIIFAKTRTTELAFLNPCETKNPHNLERTPGGSSSGSAAAVAAGMVPIAIGTQTGGSVIRPASFCGTFAIKPSFGLLPRTGVLMQSPFLDTLGVFASSVEDLALVIDVLAGYDANDNATSLAPNPQTLATCQGKVPVAPTFALVEPPHYERASQDMRDALNELGEFLGENVFSTTLPKAFEEAISARETINFAEMAKCYYRYSKNNSEQLSTILSNAITKGESTSARDYIAALDWRDLLNAGLEEFFERCDALIIPSALGGAPGLETTGDAVFNGIWTLCGNPVVNLPLFTDSEGMPMGVQIIGKRGEDGRTLRTARWLIEQLQQEVATQEVA